MTVNGTPTSTSPGRQGARQAGPRLIALVGPFQSGKTTLLESILARAGGLARQGSVSEGTSVGDASPEARAHAMSVEPNVAAVDFMGDRYTFIDCPGSVEFLHDMRQAVSACDAAVVVCEGDPRKVAALQVILHELEDMRVPRFLFLNKIDTAMARVREMLQMLQPASRVPLLLRQIPIWQRGIATGFIDLALERAFIYREHAPSVVVDIPSGELPREKEARFAMLERLADYDDELMEQLIGEIEPPRDRIFDDLARDLREGHAVPMLLGSGANGNGVTRLLKALRHEAPSVGATRARLGAAEAGPPLAQVIRTIHTAHGGKLSLARVLRGSFRDGATVTGSSGSEDRIAGLSRLTGLTQAKGPEACEGDTLAFGRLDHVATGDTIMEGRAPPAPLCSNPAPEAVHVFALNARDRQDEVRISAAFAKLCEEDPALRFEHDAESGELRLGGQGEMHLRVALERLSARFHVVVQARQPAVPYRETIRDTVSVRARHKKQSGGHGQFGDVAITVAPLDPGDGFRFAETVHGGSVPRQYFSSVEIGAREACKAGPLGFPVVDLSVTLTDGGYHSVDSSDMAFRAAARLAMAEALPKARPVLLEPILTVEVAVPEEALSRASGLVTARRGQILGYQAREGWDGWELISAEIPAAEMSDLIVELRSASAGAGSFTARFGHYAPLAGKPAESVVTARQHALQRA